MKKTLYNIAPKGYKGQIIATVNTERGYFSVTGEISTPYERARGDAQICGCIHDEISAAFPEIKPLIALHLADSETGVPMYAKENGFYWLAGYCGGLSQKYHGGQDKSPSECLKIFADLWRITKDQAEKMASGIVNTSIPAVEFITREFSAMLPIWARQAKEGIAVLESLK